MSLSRNEKAACDVALGCFGTILGVVIGVMVAVPLRLEAASSVAKTIHERGEHVCGLFTLPYLAEGVIVGTLVGGFVGLLVGSLVRSMTFLLFGWLAGIKSTQPE